MKAVLSLPRRATYHDYVAVLQSSARRFELIDGVIVAMTSGSDEHNAIAERFAGLFATRLTAGCLYYTPNQRFWIAGTVRGRYSDGSIIRGNPEHPVHDAQATTNPLVVLEVLPSSSKGDDGGDKRRDFQSLVSLQVYVLAAQDARDVKVYRRTERGDWQYQPNVYREGDGFELPGLWRAIAVDEVYDGILDVAGRSLLH